MYHTCRKSKFHFKKCTMQHMCIYNTYKHHHKVPVKQMNTVVYIKYQHNIRLEDLVLYVGYEFQVCNNNKV